MYAVSGFGAAVIEQFSQQYPRATLRVVTPGRQTRFASACAICGWPQRGKAERCPIYVPCAPLVGVASSA